MTPFEIRKAKRRMIRRSKQYIGTTPYVLGGICDPGGPGIDCRGVPRRTSRYAGVQAAYGGPQTDVRHYVAWFEEHGLLIPADQKPERGDLIFYFQPIEKPEPGNHKHLRHMGQVEQPISERFPAGKAISAVNPKWGIVEHDLALTEIYTLDDDGNSVTKPVHFGLEIYGFGRPDFSLVEPPIADPEPPIQETNP